MENVAGSSTGQDGEPFPYMTDDAAFDWMCQWRWGDVGPTCPKCGSTSRYFIASRRMFKCGNGACFHQYTPTSGTAFGSPKLPLPKLVAIMQDIEAKRSAYSTAKRHGINPKSAWIIATKMKASMEGEA